NTGLGRSDVAGGTHRNSIRHHEVNKLSHSRLFCSGGVIFRNDHLRKVLHHAVLPWGEEEGLVGSRTAPGRRRLRMVLRAGEHPSAEARKRARHCCDSDVTENFPSLHPLSAHHFPFSETSF